jgi:hypothetical protein
VGGVPGDWPTGAPVQIRCEGGGLARPITAEGILIWRSDDVAGIAFSVLGPDAATTVSDYVDSAGESARGDVGAGVVAGSRAASDAHASTEKRA